MKFGTSELGSPRPPLATAQYHEFLDGNTNTPSPPPYTKNPEPIQVGKPVAKNIIRARTMTPKNSNPDNGRSLTPASRSHSPFPMDDRDSPMPPVGENLYHGDYIYQTSPRRSTPAQPGQVGDGARQNDLYKPYYSRQEIPLEVSKPTKPPAQVVDVARAKQLAGVYQKGVKK